MVPAAGLHAGADPAGADAAPAGPGPAAGAGPAAPGRRRGRSGCSSGSRPTWCSASAGTCPPRSTWRPGGAAARSSSTSRTRCPDWPTGSRPGSPTTSSRPSPTPRCRTPPASGCRCGRGITELDRAARRTAARRRSGFPSTARRCWSAADRRAPPSINRAVLGRPRSAAGGGDLGAARGRVRRTSPTTSSPVTDPTTGAVYQPLAYIEADGPRVRRRRPDAGSLRGEHRAGDRRRRAAGRVRALPARQRRAGPQRRTGVVSAGGGLLLADADCTPEWVAAEIPA